MPTSFIDYSQYSIWNKCSWAWFEKYVNHQQKKWPAAQRDDALALGSLVHSGLENYYRHQNPKIPESVVEENTPTQDCYQLANRLIHGYIQNFPGEQWQLNFCEQPLRFPLIEGWDGLAKLDRYFYVPEATSVPSGIPGYEIRLNPGWWIHEYKTKSPHVERGKWIQQWVVKKQADFQMLALQAQKDNPESPLFDGLPVDDPTYPINGLLINVIEKPRDYIPKRKCKVCQKLWEFGSWIPVGEGHSCPMCGNVQKLKAVDTDKQEEAPQCFRVVVERTASQLEVAKKEIAMVAEMMQEYQKYGDLNNCFPANREACLDLSKKYAQECDYFKVHNYEGLVTIGNPEYEGTRDYVNEILT